MYVTRDADESLLIYTNNYPRSLKVVNIGMSSGCYVCVKQQIECTDNISYRRRKLRERQDILQQNIPSAPLATASQ